MENPEENHGIPAQIHHYKAGAEGGTATGGHEYHPVTGDPDEHLDLRPFPTLAEALLRVDEHTGFNVELKYPMRLKVRNLSFGPAPLFTEISIDLLIDQLLQGRF